MRQIKKLKQSLKKGKTYVHAMSEATKLRFTCIDLERQILYGVPLLHQKGLLEKDAFLRLSVSGRDLALRIVHEECDRQNLWKGKDLPKLARKIEKRLKEECV